MSELDIGGTDIILELTQLARAEQDSRHGALRQQPGDRNLRNTRFVRSGDRAQPLDESEALLFVVSAVRLTPDIRWSIVGSPAHFAARGRPRAPEDLTNPLGLRAGDGCSWPLRANRT